MTYKHLSLEERERIFGFSQLGLSLQNIAKKLKRNVGTISRELTRNKTGHGKVSNEYLSFEYIPCKAQVKSEKRALKQRIKAPLKNPKVFLYVREHLKPPFSWTPDEIAGRIKRVHPEEEISYETIYRYIYSKKGRKFALWQYLTLSRKKRMHKNGRSVHRDSKIPGSISIDLRPEVVSLRSRVGDWETDNLGGKTTDKTALSVSIERLSRYTVLTKLSNRLAVTKKDALIRRLGIFPKEARLTLTTDNGSENSKHQEISQDLELTIYFCHAYHSWEKGGVENMNLRIRRFIPKGTSIDNYTDEQIEEIERRLNSTPRKCLNYLTPYEKMSELLSTLPEVTVALPL